MNTEIENLALTLPAGFAARAPAIARLLGEALLAQPGLGAGCYEQLDVGVLRVDARDSDRLVAQAIAAAIGRALADGAAAHTHRASEKAPCSPR